MCFLYVWGGLIDYCLCGLVFVKCYFGDKVVFVVGYMGFGVVVSWFGVFMGLNILFDCDSLECKFDIVN